MKYTLNHSPTTDCGQKGCLRMFFQTEILYSNHLNNEKFVNSKGKNTTDNITFIMTLCMGNPKILFYKILYIHIIKMTSHSKTLEHIV